MDSNPLSRPTMLIRDFFTYWLARAIAAGAYWVVYRNVRAAQHDLYVVRDRLAKTEREYQDSGNPYLVDIIVVLRADEAELMRELAHLRTDLDDMNDLIVELKREGV